MHGINTLSESPADEDWLLIAAPHLSYASVMLYKNLLSFSMDVGLFCYGLMKRS